MALVMWFSVSVARAQEPPAGTNIPYIVVEPVTARVIAHNRAFERWHPASLTKLMTAYVTFRAIEAGEISAGSPVTITGNSQKVPPTRMNYPRGAQLRIDTALRILIVKSANDVAIALAESVAGSVSAFVDRMNAEAAGLGLADTHFTNPNGLHNTNQFTSARDMGVLAGAILNRFPQYAAPFATPSIKAGGKVHHSYNLLLERYPGATGMKTGFVCASGYNIVASARRAGRSLIAVVLGAASQTERAVAAARLLSEGFEASGSPATDLARPASPKGPTNMRPVLCTKAARQARYDPAPQTAKIDSRWLQPRKVSRQPIVVSLGGIDGDPSPAWLARTFRQTPIPVPVKRPDHVVVNVDGDVVGSAALLRTTIPVPLESPLTR